MSAPVGQVEEPTQIHNLPSTTRNLIGLSQDIAALLSLSIESGASLLHDVYRRTMGTIGLGDVMQFEPVSRAGAVGQGGKGLAVVVVGASERECHTVFGRELCLKMFTFSLWQGPFPPPRQDRLYGILNDPPPVPRLTTDFSSTVSSPLIMVTYSKTHQDEISKPPGDHRAHND